MLTELCAEIRNYFLVPGGIYRGTFTISGGELAPLDFLKQGQYFRIVGSVMNDGVYKYPCKELTDESFCGEVWAMGVPPAVIALLADINAWITKYGESTESPYQSESFAGYSYTKATDAQSNGLATWQTMFRGQLSRWRKI